MTLRKLILILLLVSSPLYAASLQMITDLGTSARMIGIGRVEGFDTTAAALFENPASLYNLENISLSGFSTRLIDQVDYFNTAVAYKSPIGTLAVGVMQAAVTDIPLSVKSGGVVSYAGQDFGYRNVVGKLGYQLTPMDHVHIGAALNLYYQEIYTTIGKGYNTDVGAIWELDQLTLSAALKNVIFFKDMNYSNGSSEDIPVQGTLAARYAMDEVDLYGQIRMPELKKQILPSAGIKYQPHSGLLYFSAGYNGFLVMDKPKSTIAIGLGLDLAPVHVNFAYDKSDYFEQDNRYFISLAVNM